MVEKSSRKCPKTWYDGYMKSLYSNQKNTATKIIVLTVLILLIGSGILFKDQIFHPNGLQVCPDEMIVNEMPGIDRSGATVDDTIPTRSNYYILSGERKEIDEFDIAWVGSNCSVPITTVQ